MRQFFGLQKDILANIKTLTLVRKVILLSLSLLSVCTNLLRINIIKDFFNVLGSDEQNKLMNLLVYFILLIVVNVGLNIILEWNINTINLDEYAVKMNEVLELNARQVSWNVKDMSVDEKLTIIGKEMENITSNSCRRLLRAITWMVTIPIYFLFTFSLNPFLAIITISLEIGIIYSLKPIMNKLQDDIIKRRENYSKWFASLKKALDYFELSTVSVNNSKLIDKINNKAFDWNKYSISTLFYILKLDQYHAFGMLISEGFLGIICVILWLNGKFQAGNIVAMLLTIRILKNELEKIPGLIEDMVDTKSSIERVKLLIKNEKYIQEEFTSENNKQLDLGISINNLCFRYNENTVALQDINVNFNSKGIYAIIGDSGSGKSTLLHCLACLLDCDYDKVSIFGNKYNSYKRTKLWDMISYITDKFFIEGSIKDNIVFGQKYDEEKFTKIKTVINDYFEMERFDEILNSKGGSLSSGEKQLIQIARMLYRNSSVMLMDEPFANIDIQKEKKLLKYMKENIAHNSCIIIATHRLDNLDLYDKVLVMKEGRLV